MKNILLLCTLLFCLSTAGMAQTGLEINGTFYTSGSTATIACGSNITISVRVKRSGLYQRINTNSTSHVYPPNWVKALASNVDTYYIVADQVSTGLLRIDYLFNGSDANMATTSINITRPFPSDIIGATQICSGQPQTYSLSNVVGSVDWTTGSGLSRTGANGGSSTQISYSSTTNSFVKARITTSNGCGEIIRTKNVSAGAPDIQQMTYGTAGTGQTNSASTVNMVNTNTWYIIRSNNFTGTTSWNINSGINGYVSATNEYRLTLTSGQTATLGLSASNSCGTSSRTINFNAPFGLRVYPNPAVDIVTLETDENSLAELGTDIEIISEKTSQIVKTLKLKVDQTPGFTQDKIKIDVTDLPKGVYYLQTSKKGRQSKERSRIIVE